jgi:tRNA(Ile)-lysidine synthetase-like protein
MSLLRRAARSLRPSIEVTADDVERVREAICSPSSGIAIDWPGGIVIRVNYDAFVIRTTTTCTRRLVTATIDVSIDSWTPIRLADPRGLESSIELGDPLALKTVRRSGVCQGRSLSRLHIDIDRARLGRSRTLVVRARRDGDRIQPTGMTGRKKLQDLLVDLHVPRIERDLIPVVTTEDGRIVWVGGCRADRRFVASPDCVDVLCLELIDDS